MRFSLLDGPIVAWDNIGLVESSWVSVVRGSEIIILRLAQGLDLLWDEESENFGAGWRGSRTLIVPELGQQAWLISKQAVVDAFLINNDGVVPIRVGSLVASDEVIFRVSTCRSVEEHGQSTECTVCALRINEAVFSGKPEVKLEVVMLAIDSVL